MRGKSGQETAAIEAFEEAGIIGRVSPYPLGPFVLARSSFDRREEYEAQFFPMFVTRQFDAWKERHQRRLTWCSIREANALVSEDELKNAINSLLKASVISGSLRWKSGPFGFDNPRAARIAQSLKRLGGLARAESCPDVR